MAYRSTAVPIDGLVRVFNAIRGSYWEAIPMPGGLRLQGRLDLRVSCAGALFAAFAAFAAFVLMTYEGTWAMVGQVVAWVVCAVSVLATGLSFRRQALVLDTEARSVRGADAVHGTIDAPFSHVSAVEIVRRPRDRGKGSATMSWIVGKSSHLILDVDDLGTDGLVRVKGVALGFATLFGTELVERSTDDAVARLAPADNAAGLPKSNGAGGSLLEKARELGADAASAAKPVTDVLDAIFRGLV